MNKWIGSIPSWLLWVVHYSKGPSSCVLVLMRILLISSGSGFPTQRATELPVDVICTVAREWDFLVRCIMYIGNRL